jgi:hypothetical protein
MTIQEVISRLRSLIGLDRAIVFTIFARGWAGISTIALIALIARFLSPSEQGYYYSFSSLVAVQAIFELGFSFVILQLASHERAHLEIVNGATVVGPPRSHGRLASVIQKTVRWYASAAVLMTAILIPIGVVFFRSHSTSSPSIAWQMPWYCVVLAATMTFQLDPVFSFLEGCGYVPEVARTRFIQSLLGSLFAALALLTHHGLFAPSLLIFGKALGGSNLLWRRRRLILNLLRHQVGEHYIAWKTEVWPFQWRVAVCWISGYFTFELFSPILFAFHGPVAAGQMGMSLTLCNGLTTLAYAWLSTKAAPIGMMVARREFKKLDNIFFRALSQSVTIVILGSLTFWFTIYSAKVHSLAFSHRLLDPSTLSLLLVAMVANTVWFSEALYIRAHKQEKFMGIQLCSAILIAISCYFVGRPYGAFGMSAAYAIVNVFIGIGFGTFTFLKFRRLQHIIPEEIVERL